MDSSCKLCLWRDSSNLRSVIWSSPWRLSHSCMVEGSARDLDDVFIQSAKLCTSAFSFLGFLFHFLAAVVVPNCVLKFFRTVKLYNFLSYFYSLYKALKSLSTAYAQAKTCKSRKLNVFFLFISAAPVHNLLAFISSSRVFR